MAGRLTVRENDQLGIRLDAIETALHVAQQEPSISQRRQLLGAVQRAARAARAEHCECPPERPHLRVVPTSTETPPVTTIDAPSKRRIRGFTTAVIAVAVTAVITAVVTLALVGATFPARSDAPHAPAPATPAPHRAPGQTPHPPPASSYRQSTPPAFAPAPGRGPDQDVAAPATVPPSATPAAGQPSAGAEPPARPRIPTATPAPPPSATPPRCLHLSLALVLAADLCA